MSKRTATWLAWSMCALSLVLEVLSLFLLVLNLSYPGVPVYPFWAENIVVGVGFSPVGAVIASRISPKNPMGWLFCATGLLFVVSHFSAQYAIYAVLAAPGSLPAGEAAAWILSLVWVPAVGLLVFIGLLFPDGRLPSPRWRWFFWLSLLLILGGAILHAFTSGTVIYLGNIYNPLGVEELPTSNYVGDLLQMLLTALILVSVASLLVRRLRATGVERQQLKWFTYSTALTVIGIVLTYVISEATGSVLLGWAGYVLGLVGFLGIPISMGIAILRYRLYEIDLIINRTLVYGLLTATLALFYFGSVTALQSLFSLLTGQGNTLAIVASTLAIAALFMPFRRRIQSFIDRRFYRRKYDARKTLEAFGSKLRDETDLEKLCKDLGEVVDETMQPAHLSVILRSEVPSSTTTKEQGQQEDQQTIRHEED
jgi:hypothetical protein